MSFSSLWSHSLSRKNRRVIWALLFVIALVPRAWYISATDSTNLVNQDPMCRINIANAWMVEDQYPRTMVWPPLHMVLLALPSYLSGHVPYEKIDKGISVEDGGRALTAVLGSLLVVFIFEWALLFLPWQGAFASALTMAFWPLSVYLGSITLAEVPFMAFLFAALLALIRYRQSPQLRWIYVAAVLFNCASLIRFEGWLFATTLPLILVLPMMGWKPSSSGKTHLLLLWLFNSLAPFYSLAKSAQLHGGDMLRALTINQLETEAEAVVFAKTIGLQSQLSKIIANALMPNYSWFGLLILVGLIWHLRQRKFMALLLLVCIPALPKYWSVLSFAIPSDPRYLFTSTCLLWPLGFFLLA